VPGFFIFVFSLLFFPEKESWLAESKKVQSGIYFYR
jgi:hypothetical protein